MAHPNADQPTVPSTAPADACSTLASILHDDRLEGSAVYHRTVPARAPDIVPIPGWLHADLRARLTSRGIDTLWSHQAAALDALSTQRNVVVASGTASGKSLCYQLPIVDAAVRGAHDTALLIFPTKALANDQLRSLRSWLVPGLRAVTYDGDTPS
jgi:DEAD/DEAH box helicase domain-containing protein